MRLDHCARRGMTLVELLVVIVIILLASVVVLGAGALSAYNHRQVSEAARLLQGALVGARDKAIHDGQPCGIRLLLDPAFPITYSQANGQVTGIDPASLLVYNRIVPLDTAPEYSEGAVSIYPASGYPLTVTTGRPCLILEEAVLDAKGLPNAPTSWAWNIRVGDRIQIGQAGPWYTVIGPMGIGPFQGNSELFINYGTPPSYPIVRGNVTPEYLLLVNGRDDNGNGWIDEGWDGVDNDGDGTVDQTGNASEWEAETWLGAIQSTPASPATGAVLFSVLYTIARRPAPAVGAREIALPTSMVIDATTAFLGRERSRLPVNNPSTILTGSIDIMINADGTVLPTTMYSSPTSFGMDQAFYHFWLSERQDVVVPSGKVAPTLPIMLPRGASPGTYPIPVLKGPFAILTLNARSGNITNNMNPLMDDPVAASQAGLPYKVSLPFMPAQQGISSP